MSGTAFDAQKLSVLLGEFRLLTGVRISFWNASGVRRVTSGLPADSDFCSRLRGVPELDAACRCCDAAGLREARRTGRTVVFACHAGLHEYVCPVRSGADATGYFMIGQVSMPDVYGDIFGERAEKWEKYGLDIAELRELYARLPVMTHEKMLAAAHMLEALAGYVYMSGLVRRSEPPLCEKISRHIEENLASPLSLDSVAEALHVSRSTLCHTARAELGASVTELVNAARVRRSQELLENGSSVGDAARGAGFSSPGYFSRVFRRTAGVTPEKYRAKFIVGEEDII